MIAGALNGMSVAFALGDVDHWDFKLQVWPYVIHILREITPTPFAGMKWFLDVKAIRMVC